MQNETLNDDASGDSVKSSEVMEKLGAYVDGELSSAEREAIERLLERDRSCRAVVQSFRFLDEAARRETVPAVNSQEWARIWDVIQIEKDQPVRSTEPVTAANPGGGRIVQAWHYRLAAAAAVIALALLGFQALSTPDSDNRIVQPQPRPEVSSPEVVDNGEPDEDAETRIGQIDIEMIEGDAPDEISEDGVKYHDF